MILFKYTTTYRHYICIPVPSAGSTVTWCASEEEEDDEEEEDEEEGTGGELEEEEDAADGHDEEEEEAAAGSESLGFLSRGKVISRGRRDTCGCALHATSS